MPTNAGKSGSTLWGELEGGRLDGISGTIGFPLERRVSLMLTMIQRLLGGWAFALAFRRGSPAWTCPILQLQLCLHADGAK